MNDSADDPAPSRAPAQPDPPAPTPPRRWHTFLREYAWFLGKNILGWLLIGSSFILGPAVPGPGGIPLFLIGFALITFPGKRHLTARVLRGRRLSGPSPLYTRVSLATSLILPVIVAALLSLDWHLRHRLDGLADPVAVAICLVLSAAVILWTILRLLPAVVNLLLPLVPPIRRRIRPWMRQHGMHLLPPRRHRHLHHPHHSHHPPTPHRHEPIMEFTERFWESLLALWHRLRPWVVRIVGLAVIAAIAWIMLPGLVEQWQHVRPRLGRIHWGLFALACGMFAVSQFAVRLTAWRWVLRGLGYHLPMRPAARIWAAGELARLIPGAIWQVLSRAWLARSYGVPVAVTSISHILEVTIYLLANVLVGTLCLPWLIHGVEASVKHVLIAAAVLLPLLAIVLYPPVFFGAINLLLKRLKQEPLPQRLSERMLVFLLSWAVIWQAWLALGMWLVVGPVLNLPLSRLPLLAAANCLAWTAGFCLAWLAPTGIGIRELVLSAALAAALPTGHYGSLHPEARAAVFVAVALLVRLWATGGEAISLAIAFACDLGRPRRPRATIDSPPAQA